jgi:hypothetical protein
LNITESLHSLSYEYRRPDINRTVHEETRDYAASKVYALNTSKNINRRPNEVAEQELHSFHCSSNIKAMNTGSRPDM